MQIIIIVMNGIASVHIIIKCQNAMMVSKKKHQFQYVVIAKNMIDLFVFFTYYFYLFMFFIYFEIMLI